MNKIKKLLPLIGIAVFVYLLVSIGIEEIWSSLLEVRLEYILLSLLLFPPIAILQTHKWNILLRKQGINLEFSYIFKLYLIGLFYGVLTPGKLGSFIRIPYLQEKLEKSIGECSSSVILDRVLDLFALFTLAIIGSVLLIQYISNLFWMMLLVFIIFMSFFLVFMHKETSTIVLQAVYRFLVPAKLKEKSKLAFHSFYDSLPRIKDLSIPFTIGLISWVLIYVQGYYLVGLALGIEIPFIYFITIMPIGAVVGLMPITVSGFGTRDAMVIFLLALFGITAEKAMAISLLGYTINAIFPALLGSFLLIKEQFILSFVSK